MSRQGYKETERVKAIGAKMNVKREVLFACNEFNKTEVLLDFSCFEQMQSAFRCGILLPDDTQATGIGRCADLAEFIDKAKNGQWTVLPCGGAK